MFKKISTLTILSLFSLSQSFAIYDPDVPVQECLEGQMCIMTLSTMPAPIMQSTYAASENFLTAEGYICESATDGINTFFINEGELGGSTRIGYPEDFTAEWKCNAYLSENMMLWSENDRNHFNTLLKNTPETQKEKVRKAVIKVENLLSGKSIFMQEKYLDAILELIDTLKMEIILNNPQDIALPEKDAAIYNMLSLLRFTLMTL